MLVFCHADQQSDGTREDALDLGGAACPSGTQGRGGRGRSTASYSRVFSSRAKSAPGIGSLVAEWSCSFGQLMLR